MMYGNRSRLRLSACQTPPPTRRIHLIVQRSLDISHPQCICVVNRQPLIRITYPRIKFFIYRGREKIFAILQQSDNRLQRDRWRDHMA